MNLLDHLRRMAGNNLWSNDRLYRAVLQLKPGEFEAERTSFFPSLKATLNHILAVDHLYLDFLEEGGVGAAAYDDFLLIDEPEALFAAQVAADRRLIAFCDRLSAGDLDRQVATDRREDGMIRSASATSSPTFSCMTSITAARCTRCCPAPRSRHRSWMSFCSTMI